MSGNFDVEAFGTDFFIVMMLVYLITIGLGLAQYIMFSLGLYDTARKRGIPGAWSTWIPLVGHWVLGAVADHYSLQRGGKRRWGKVMLVICIAIVASYALFFGTFLIGGVAAVLANEVVTDAATIAWIVCMLLGYIALILAFIAYVPCYTVCLYKVYEEIVPDKAVKYLLLSFLVPLAIGFCMLRCGKVPACAEAPQPERDFIPQDPFALTERK